MQIVWDDPKRETNLSTHGMDFADLTMEFFANSKVFPAKKDRYMAIGEFAGSAITVVFSPLGSEAIAVISMRPASQKERLII